MTNLNLDINMRPDKHMEVLISPGEGKSSQVSTKQGPSKNTSKQKPKA